MQDSLRSAPRRQPTAFFAEFPIGASCTSCNRRAVASVDAISRAQASGGLRDSSFDSVGVIWQLRGPSQTGLGCISDVSIAIPGSCENPRISRQSDSVCDDPMETGNMVPTFLNSLSPDMTRTVFRFFSDHPQASNWESYVRMEDLHPVYCGDSALSELCRAQYTELCIARRGGASGNALVISPNSTGYRGLTKQAKQMLDVGARYIAKLSARRALFPWMERLFVNLKELELHCREEDIEPILKGLPSQLHSLRLHFAPSKTDFNAIPVHCT